MGNRASPAVVHRNTFRLLEGEIELPRAAFRQFDEFGGKTRDPVRMIHSHLAEIGPPDVIWVCFRIDLEDLPPFPLLSACLFSEGFVLLPIFLPPTCESRSSYSYPINNPAKYQETKP